MRLLLTSCCCWPSFGRVVLSSKFTFVAKTYFILWCDDLSRKSLIVARWQRLHSHRLGAGVHRRLTPGRIRDGGRQSKEIGPSRKAACTKHALRIMNDLLKDLNDYFKNHDFSNASFGIEMPDNQLIGLTTGASNEVDPNAKAFFDQNIGKLNRGQRKIYDKFVQLLTEDNGGCLNIDAPGGCGKTFLAEVMMAHVRKEGHVAVAAAMSGIAATLLTLGTTCHKRFGVPVPCTHLSSSKHMLNSKESNVIKGARILLIDEVSMMDYNILDVIDRYLRVLMICDTPFGGKLIMLLHDFRQILPVIPNGSRAAVVSASVKNSDMWKCFTKMSLDENMRVSILKESGNKESTNQIEKLNNHALWLLQVGNGTAPSPIKDSNIMEVPAQMVRQSKEELEEAVYDNFEANYTNPEYLAKRAIMSARNDTILEQNFRMINKIPTQEDPTVYLSRDICMDPDDQQRYDADTLNILNPSGLPPHRLVVKVGAVIILIKNMSMISKHCNGTRYIITQLTANLIFARKLKCEGNADDDVLIPRIPTISKDTEASFVSFKRTQFPILVAYYMTLNRAQGQTLERAGMYLPTSVFSHGHLYVGFSRCGNPDNFSVYADQSEFENLQHLLDKNKTYTRNVVFDEIFRYM